MASVNRLSVKVAMPSDKPPILFRVQPEFKAALERIARDQNRSLSNLVETAMIEWAEKNLPKGAKPKKARP